MRTLSMFVFFIHTLVFCVASFAQNSEVATFTVGAKNNDVNKKEDLKDPKTIFVGLQYRGIELGSEGYRVLPFSAVVNIKGKLSNAKLRDYKIALFGIGGEWKNSWSKSEFRMNLGTFDRENFRNTKSSALVIDRMKFVEINYKTTIDLGNDNYQILFEGTIAPMHSTRTSETPNDLQEQFDQVADGDYLNYGSGSSNKGIDKILGQGPEIYDPKNTKLDISMFNGFFGDFDVAVGISLFKLLQAKLSYQFDSAQGITDTRFLSMTSRKTTLEANVNIGAAFKKSQALKGLSLFVYAQKDKFKTKVEEKDPDDPKFYAEIENKQYNAVGMGLRYKFFSRKKN